MRKIGTLERFARWATKWTGSSWAFALAVAIIVIWLVTGPIFHYSDTWQLVINTGTTIVTFLMVFLIQRAQNKESLAVQLKLNEIVAALDGASCRLINVEDLSEKDVEILHKHYQKLAELAKHNRHLTESHSIEEAERRYRIRRRARRLAELRVAEELPAPEEQPVEEKPIEEEPPHDAS
jgi:low affinity Fe/Cu permease